MHNQPPEAGRATSREAEEEQEEAAPEQDTWGALRQHYSERKVSLTYVYWPPG